MAEINLSNQTCRQRTDLWPPREGEGEGQTWSLGLGDANYYM